MTIDDIGNVADPHLKVRHHWASRSKARAGGGPLTPPPSPQVPFQTHPKTRPGAYHENFTGRLIG